MCNFNYAAPDLQVGQTEGSGVEVLKLSALFSSALPRILLRCLRYITSFVNLGSVEMFVDVGVDSSVSASTTFRAGTTLLHSPCLD